MRYSWARLWYYLRAIDAKGWRRKAANSQPNDTYCQNSGLIKDISFQETKRYLGCSGSTLYQWLREARVAGAVYEYRRKGDRLRIRLGGLFNVCRTNGLRRWGAVAVLPLKEVLNKCRELATAIAIQQLQEKSRYAAHKTLSKGEKQTFKIPDAFDVIEKGRTASLKPDRGANKIPFLLHVGAKRAFVSKGFIPFGASQGAIASELAISDRTVRRHLVKLGVESRQLVQAKHAYRFIKAGIQLNLGDALIEPNISYQIGDRSLLLHEPNGSTNSKREGGHEIPMSGNSLSSDCDRFFNYYGKTWIYRCSLYDLAYEFSSMRFARRKYKKQGVKHKDNLSSKPCAVRNTGYK